MKIIKGENNFDYTQSLDDLELETMEKRRDKICFKFAKNCLRNEKFKHWFPKKSEINTRSSDKYILPRWKTKRYLKSSIPHLIDVLNKMNKSKSS